LDKGLDNAATGGWNIISMKDDWVHVFKKY
jgi:hypothetical protein